MMEFSTPITQEQKEFLLQNKNDLLKPGKDGKPTNNGGYSIWQNRVKRASEAYKIAQGINAQHSLTSLVNKSLEDENDDVDSDVPDWATFRDNFILDWIGSRIVVTEKEADMIFERTADEALAAIEQNEQNEQNATATVEVVNEPTTVTLGDVPAVKRRGRPAGKKPTKTAAKSTKARTVAKKTTRKAAAKKKGGSASMKAQVIIEKYASRDWSRKDIIAKLQAQLGMGAAYASTLYQKFA